MLTNTFLITYLRDGAQAHDSDTIEHFLAMLARRGYALRTIASRDGLDASYTLLAGVAPDLRRELGMYLAGRTREFAFHACPADPDRAVLLPSLRCCLSPEEGMVFLYTHSNLFGPGMVAKRGRDHLLCAPADYIRQLDDGGVFLVPITVRDIGAVSDGRNDLPTRGTRLPDARFVAHHLGMEYMDWSAYFARRVRMWDVTYGM